MKIEILCTGDEILTGKTINSNYSYIAQRLVDAGLGVHWGTTVGDDSDDLMRAFKQAAQRADAVIVNGGLGPTVDDLSQEIAARAAGVALELNTAWLDKLQAFYTSRGRIMPPNNRKQAMLPAGCEFIDNPIGTACGFAVQIDGARFYFSPGVPREMRRMIDEQIVPRILQSSGLQIETALKRFHTYGIGESRADELLKTIPELAGSSVVKLGFQSHFPQLETKLAARAGSREELELNMAPLEKKVRALLGNFVVSEDDQTLESGIISKLHKQNATLATMEMFSAGGIAMRLQCADAGLRTIRRNIVSQRPADLYHAVSAGEQVEPAIATGNARFLAEQLRQSTGSTYALVTLIATGQTDPAPDAATEVNIAIATPAETVIRTAKLMGGTEWVRLGSTEMSLDCLRRHLYGLPVQERSDFEQQ